MSKPKFVKPLLIGVACTIPVGLVVGLSVNWDHTQYISAVGSSGVKPFIEKFGKIYRESHKNFDVTVESGGTTFAIEQVAKGFTTLGNASNNPYQIIENQDYSKQWTNKKTLTLGWEGLCLMYSLPKGMTQPDKFNIVINDSNILKLYGVFSCWHELKDEEWKEEYETLWYYGDENKESLPEQDKKLLKETKILPFVRAGGNTAANSSIAFSYYSNLTEHDDMSDMTDNQQKAFAGGQYGDDSDFMETDESNTRAWQSFVAKDKPGSMVYLTTSFLTNENNRQQIKDRGYKLAGYQYPGYEPAFINNVKDLEKIATTENGYNWYRPINVMIDLNTQKAKDFVYWMYFDTDEDMSSVNLSDQYKDFVYSLGAKPLNNTQFATMFKDELSTSIKDLLFDGASSDIEIENNPSRKDYQKIYGAIDLWNI